MYNEHAGFGGRSDHQQAGQVAPAPDDRFGTASRPTCLACGRPGVVALADLGLAPVLNGVTFEDRETARSAVLGPLDLAACPGCGHAMNVAFDASLLDYDAEYDNSLHFSPTFREYNDALAQRLVADYDLRNGRVVEIGSGKGEFLASVTAASGSVGVGYDPSTPPDESIPNVTLVSEYYRPGQDVEHYDLLVCRHVLEHLDDPAAILTSLRSAAPSDAVFYFEVPAAEQDFGPEGMWAFIYPHVSYFSAGSLHTLIRRCGFEILRSGRSFGNQFLWVEARAGAVDTTPADAAEHLALLADFQARQARTVATWREEIQRRSAQGEGTALWGAGARGVSFVNIVDPDATLTVVDLNDRKWGRFLPGTGHEVISPDTLPAHGVTKVLITNPVYWQEIERHLHELGVDADIVAV